MVDMKVKGERCLGVGRAVRELEVSGTPSELQLSLISLLYRRILHITAENTLSPAASPASQTHCSRPDLHKHL